MRVPDPPRSLVSAHFVGLSHFESLRSNLSIVHSNTSRVFSGFVAVSGRPFLAGLIRRRFLVEEMANGGGAHHPLTTRTTRLFADFSRTYSARIPVFFCNLIHMARAFFTLSQAKGEPAKGHPVVRRLLSLRGLLEDMSGLDEKMSSQVDLLLRALKSGVDLAGAGEEEEEGRASICSTSNRRRCDRFPDRAAEDRPKHLRRRERFLGFFMMQ